MSRWWFWAVKCAKITLIGRSSSVAIWLSRSKVLRPRSVEKSRRGWGRMTPSVAEGGRHWDKGRKQVQGNQWVARRERNDNSEHTSEEGHAEDRKNWRMKKKVRQKETIKDKNSGWKEKPWQKKSILPRNRKMEAERVVKTRVQTMDSTWAPTARETSSSCVSHVQALRFTSVISFHLDEAFLWTTKKQRLRWIEGS